MSSVAVAIMVDSSLNLANHWAVVLGQYISPILSRLIENRTSSSFHLGFLTYATFDTYPNPILTKRYFAHPQYVTKELKEDPQRLGIGQTTSGGSEGMAVLEGFVAALEMFDYFLESKSGKDEPPGSLSLHILHVSYGLPDDTPKPLHNFNHRLDDITWSSLPEEIRNRKISLHTILLRSNAQLSDLHKQASIGSTVPWFTVRAGHNVLLSGLSQPLLANPTVLKEDNLLPSDIKASSKSPVLQKDQSSTTAAVSQAQANTLSHAQRVVQQMRVLEMQIKQGMQELLALQQAGRTQELGEMKKALQLKTASYSKLKTLLKTFTSLNAASSAGTTAAPQITLDGNVAVSQDAADSSANDPISLPLASASKPVSSATAEALANQMQKLEQQRARSGLISQSSGQNNAQVDSTKGPLWQGSLSWLSNDPLTHVEKDFNAEVIASSATGEKMGTESWPSALTLTISKENSVPLSDLRLWMRRHTPKMYTIAPQVRTFSKEMNDFNFKLLHSYLLERNLYALVGWDLPSGKRDNTMVIFAVPQRNLAAAVFPETGVPELPKSTGAPLPTNLSLLSLHNGTAPLLPPGIQNLSLQQRQELAARIIAHRHMQAQALHTQNTAQQRGALYANNTSSDQGAMTVQSGLNAQIPNAMFGQLQPNASHISQPAAGTGGNVSMEMMQSFIQRNPDSTSGL